MFLKQYAFRSSDPAGPGAGYAARCSGAIPDHKDVPAHPEMSIQKCRFVRIHFDLRIVHDCARMEDAGDNGVEHLHGRPYMAHDLGWHCEPEVSCCDWAAGRK